MSDERVKRVVTNRISAATGRISAAGLPRIAKAIHEAPADAELTEAAEHLADRLEAYQRSTAQISTRMRAALARARDRVEREDGFRPD